MKQISYKNFFLNYSIFVLIAAAIFGILIYVVKVSQKSWDKNLKTAIESTFAETEPDTWELGKSITINNPLTTNAACYDARNKRSGESYKVVIIKLQTFYGPHAGIYIVDKNSNVTFKGYASMHGRVAMQLANSFSGRRVEYWKLRIAEMFK